MSSSFGTHVTYTLFGESHSAAIGITIDGLPPGIQVDFERINETLALRRGAQAFNTARIEQDNYEILSGYFNDQTTGAPFTVVFPNNDTRSKDYTAFQTQPRPGHADYVAQLKHNGANDPRGGGHFSGRMTTPLVFCGAMVLQLIQKDYPDFSVQSHISQLHNIADATYYERRHTAMHAAFAHANTQAKLDGKTLAQSYDKATIKQAYHAAHSSLQSDFTQLHNAFPVLDTTKITQMQAALTTAITDKTTLGGKIETVVFHPPVAIGEPFFHSIESTITSLLFSVGSVKAVSFGYGEYFSTVTGTEVKDEIITINDDRIATLYNYNGGINGGITNGEDIVINTTFKPISSIGQPQYTFHTANEKIERLDINGRHDVSIVNRIIPVIEAMVVIGLYDLLRRKNR